MESPKERAVAAVSSLRSKFEQLAASASHPSSPTSHSPRPSPSPLTSSRRIFSGPDHSRLAPSPDVHTLHTPSPTGSRSRSHSVSEHSPTLAVAEGQANQSHAELRHSPSLNFENVKETNGKPPLAEQAMKRAPPPPPPPAYGVRRHAQGNGSLRQPGQLPARSTSVHKIWPSVNDDERVSDRAPPPVPLSSKPEKPALDSRPMHPPFSSAPVVPQRPTRNSPSASPSVLNIPRSASPPQIRLHTPSDYTPAPPPSHPASFSSASSSSVKPPLPSRSTHSSISSQNDGSQFGAAELTDTPPSTSSSDPDVFADAYTPTSEHSSRPEPSARIPPRVPPRPALIEGTIRSVPSSPNNSAYASSSLPSLNTANLPPLPPRSSTAVSPINPHATVPSHPPPPPPSHPFKNSRPVSAIARHDSLDSPRLPTRQPPSPSPSIASLPPPVPTTTRPSFIHNTLTDDITPPSVPSSAPARLPPPPTRTIGLHDKLPPRRQTAGELESLSSGESEDETSTTTAARRSLDLAPDSTHSSRRPPSLPSPLDAPIHVSAHHAVVASKGPHVVIASQHHFRIHTVSLTGSSASTVIDVDIPDLKKGHVCAMEWAPGNGDMMWAGTKEGMLLLIDVGRACVADTRSGWHSHQVTHVLRHRGTMISLDETGKLVMFEPGSAGMGKPRTLRMPDKTQFVGVFGERIWSSLGTGSGSSAIRVYDVLPSQSSLPGPSSSASSSQTSLSLAAPAAINSKPLLLSPTENIGPVTAGSYLPSHPSTIYLGHEGGYISIWDALNPQCLDIIKVGSSDILCLLGVGSRLWAGGRKGVISAYDVSENPWRITNQWKAHEELPVLSLTADPHSIDPFGHLSVMSVGRDEKARFWDGFLGAEWIDKELLKREVDFSTFRKLKVLVCTWNVDAARPDQLAGNIDDAGFLESLLRSVDRPDIICFGFQEMIDLENRKLTAKTVLLGRTKKKAGDHVSEKVSRSYKQWYDRLVFAVRLAMPPDDPYSVVHTENLVGLFTCIFVRNSERKGGSLTDERITTVKRGMGGRFGNKGAIVARFVIDDSSICFINCHLAAGQGHKRQRNNDLAAILEEKSVFPASGPIDEAVAYVGGGDGSMILDHEICFLNGDLNYRIDQRRDAVIQAIENNDLASLLAQDQLLKEMHTNPAFRLRSFREAPISFAPTYKYDRHSSSYDSSEKKRIPAWCDRILYKTRADDRVVPLHYQRYEAKVSDHRPVSAGYEIVVKQIRHERREEVQNELRTKRAFEELKLFSEAKGYYRMLGIM